ncbi:hypothetical protein EVAR_7932_1 [Eumeta japonica]|uniref:Lipocalin/cytosolic fatty-acid binding domain-containing protein n=1 Tax=Eumeta variegata TaxID=151549 RepID=A0A4C1TV96_EUMVA|nr:hypothetical protein EVAR_7932_1 [Eumeta japonica]
MYTRNPRGVTSALPASWVGIEYLMEERVDSSRERWGDAGGIRLTEKEVGRLTGGVAVMREEVDNKYVRRGHVVHHVVAVGAFVYVDRAVDAFEDKDPVAIPMSVVATDYQNYAVIYGCKQNDELAFKYVSAFILSRRRSLTEQILENARNVINTLPHSSTIYLETVSQSNDDCDRYWTAHVQAEYSDGY